MEMECQQCLHEHAIMIAKYNYGYSYIGKLNNCHRHKNTYTPIYQSRDLTEQSRDQSYCKQKVIHK